MRLACFEVIIPHIGCYSTTLVVCLVPDVGKSLPDKRKPLEKISFARCQTMSGKDTLGTPSFILVIGHFTKRRLDEQWLMSASTNLT